MNIAILISGRIELFNHAVKHNYERIINLLINQGHTVNIFMSVWECDDTRHIINSYNQQIKIVDVETLSEYTGSLIDNYKEYENLASKYGNSKDHKVKYTMFWLYKLKRCYKLVQEYERVNNINHDLYIRLRSNVTVSLPLNINDLKNLTDDSIYVHEDQIVKVDNTIFGCGNGWIDDNFCIARKRPFELFCKVYDDIIDLCNKSESCISHILLKTQFQKHNIKIVKPNSPLVMYRMSDDKTQWQQYIYFTYLYPWFKL